MYLSWENAVIKAIERYNIVLDLYRSGAYKEHDTFSDNLLATQGDMMYTLARIGKALEQGKQVAQTIFGSRDYGQKKKKKQS